jgi:hypothetical protein
MSAFTALNGADKPAEATIQVADPARPASSGEADGQTSTAPINKPTKPAERESWSTPSSIPQRRHQSTPSYAEPEPSHKRKRSDTDDMRRDQPPPASQRDHSPHEATVRPAPAEPRVGYESRDREYQRYGDEHRQSTESWYAGQSRDGQTNYEHSQSQRQPLQAQTSPQNQTPPMRDRSDDAGSEPGRREASRTRADTEDPGTSPDIDDRSASAYATSPYSAERKDMGLAQMDPKKRKRNFSNRTKTGCLTCRKRKKKCDEQKPECKFLPRGLEHQPGHPSMHLNGVLAW